MTTIRALLLGILLCEPCCASPADREVGALLRDGTWDGGVGTYHPPEVFSAIKPAAWPADGWYRIRLEADRAGEFGGIRPSTRSRTSTATACPIS